MGIHGLAKLIADQAPGAIKEQDIKNYFGHHYSLFLLICFQLESVSWCLNLDILCHECDALLFLNCCSDGK